MVKKRMKNRIIFTAVILILSIMTAGCWDRIEIEELGIIAGIAIDCPENALTAGNSAGMQNSAAKSRNIEMTYQYVIPKGLGGGERGASPQKKPYSNLSRRGSSIYQIMSDFYNISSRRPNYEHLKVMIISEEAARSFNLYKLLNGFLRHPEMPRNVSMVVSEGMAGSMLEIEPELEDVPSFELNMITRFEKETLKKLSILTAGEMAGKMASEKSFAVPRVVKSQDALKVIGAAVIRGEECKMAGWLDESETEGLNWLTGRVEGGAVETEDEQTGETIVCRIREGSSKITPFIQNNNLSFTVEIEAEGDISEDWLMGSDALKQEFIGKVERAVEKEIKGRILKALDKIQKEYKTDVAGFGKRIEIKYPDIWSKIKDGWDERFSNIPIETEVKMFIRGFGRRSSKK